MEDRTDEPGLPPPSWDAGAGAAEAGAAEAGAESVGSAGAGAGADQQRPVTGEPRVDAALARLDELPELPVTEHRAVFEHVHRSLSEVLGELDTGNPRG
jgi:hypothetical protein